LYNIIIQFGIPMKLVRLIKLCLNETYSKVQVGKYLSHKSPIKNGLKQSCFIATAFQLCLAYPIRSVQVYQDDLKLNGIYLLLVYADYVNKLARCVHTFKQNTEPLVVRRLD
jgi:hypothetical protein